MPIQTIKWNRNKVKLIDQTELPNRLKYVYCRDVKSIWNAIRALKVRGAPAIGIAGALGVVLGIRESRASHYKEFEIELRKVTGYLAKSRPTAVNLFWALERMERVSCENSNKKIYEIKALLLKEALKIIEEDKEVSRKMAEYGVRLLNNGDTVLTHCNAGGLATADYGTALGVIYKAKEMGKKIKVYADETRPLLQGSRLTAWELMKNGIDVTLICDNMAAEVMKEGRIAHVFVGADRIAANGDTANKIGTYGVALLARAHNIPFYVVAPVSTFDLTLKSGDGIPIEERGRDEIIAIFGTRTAPRNVKVYNPAFDVTPARLITAIVTEKGILRPPYKKSISQMVHS